MGRCEYNPYEYTMEDSAIESGRWIDTVEMRAKGFLSSYIAMGGGQTTLNLTWPEVYAISELINRSKNNTLETDK